MSFRPIALVVAGLLIAACGDNEAAAPDAGDGFTDLISSAWRVDAPGDYYWCERLTVDRDLYIGGLEAIAPPGTHHTVLTVGAPDEPDGGSECNVATVADAAIFASGVGTNSFSFPPGVAVKVAKGQQLLLNLHLFNTTDAALTGTSGTRVKLVDPADVVQEAEVVLAGKVPSLEVPPGDVDQVGTCIMNGDVTLLAVAPHMHKTGVHMKVTASTSAGFVTLHDGDYSFNEQKIYPIDPIEVSAGQAVTVTCSYHNDTPDTLKFGESSNDEMCFAGLVRYPAFGGDFGIVCATN